MGVAGLFYSSSFFRSLDIVCRDRCMAVAAHTYTIGSGSGDDNYDHAHRVYMIYTSSSVEYIYIGI